MSNLYTQVPIGAGFTVVHSCGAPARLEVAQDEIDNAVVITCDQCTESQHRWVGESLVRWQGSTPVSTNEALKIKSTWPSG